jgi:hypothetical protein
MRSTFLTLLSPLALLACGAVLTACGGGGSADPTALANEAAKARGGGDWAEARGKYVAARDAVGPDTANPQFLRVNIGAIEAQAHLDADAALEELRALEASSADALGDREYAGVATELKSAGSVSQAILACDAGLKRFPDSERLNKLIEDLQVLAAKPGNEGAADLLDSLGYSGGD